jgi:hypothetical protein
MYPTVPITTPGSDSATRVTVGSAPAAAARDTGRVSFASPKSTIFARPSDLTITFSGFRSR